MIVRANAIKSRNELLPGRKILIPEADYCMKAGQEGYITCAGETVYSTANRLGIPMYELMAENGLKTPAELRPGMRIKTGKSTGYTTYTVRQGDDMDSIAREQRTTKEEIMRLNNIGLDIYPGMQLLIKGRK